MFRKVSPQNQQREFDPCQTQTLGLYVYALRDPRDGKIFYVGQGRSNRIFQHFQEAEGFLRTSREPSSKILRIIDVWKNEEDVEWVILAYNLENNTANYVESAAYNALGQSQNGTLLNENLPPRSTLLTAEAVQQFGAEEINPPEKYDFVFVFPIQNGLANRENPYEATRKYWYVKEEYRRKDAFAVGLNKGVSVTSFKIDKWSLADGRKSEFEGVDYPALSNKRWGKILSQAEGYWKRGNYLIVSFDGKGNARIIRGAGEARNWFPLKLDQPA